MDATTTTQVSRSGSIQRPYRPFHALPRSCKLHWQRPRRRHVCIRSRYRFSSSWPRLQGIPVSQEWSRLDTALYSRWFHVGSWSHIEPNGLACLALHMATEAILRIPGRQTPTPLQMGISEYPSIVELESATLVGRRTTPRRCTTMATFAIGLLRAGPRGRWSMR